MIRFSSVFIDATEDIFTMSKDLEQLIMESIILEK